MLMKLTLQPCTYTWYEIYELGFNKFQQRELMEITSRFMFSGGGGGGGLI